MVCWELKALRTDRMTFVLQVSAEIGEREGMENLENQKKELGEDYARKILEFLERKRQDEKKERI